MRLRRYSTRTWISRKADEKFVMDIVSTLGLEKKLHNLPNTLSGGQQQRVAIARALASKPDILFADEPTGNLDSRTSDEVIALLKMSVDKYGQTLVMITHDEDIAQIAEIQKRSEFDRIGRAAVIGEIENVRTISMVWMDEETMQLTNMEKQLQEGSFPEKENEIAGQKAMFERLGYPDAKPGDTVTVSFRRNNAETYQEKEFIISGIVEQSLEELENQSYTAYVSQACYESLYRPEERAYSIYFTLSDAVSVNSSTLEMTIKDLAESCGINPEYAVVNGYYSMWVMDPGAEMITGCIVVALIVVFFAVLVIYNIFQVGLVQKIQEYGKIRALGATKK